MEQIKKYLGREALVEYTTEDPTANEDAYNVLGAMR